MVRYTISRCNDGGVNSVNRLDRPVQNTTDDDSATAAHAYNANLRHNPATCHFSATATIKYHTFTCEHKDACDAMQRDCIPCEPTIARMTMNTNKPVAELIKLAIGVRGNTYRFNKLNAPVQYTVEPMMDNNACKYKNTIHATDARLVVDANGADDDD